MFVILAAVRCTRQHQRIRLVRRAGAAARLAKERESLCKEVQAFDKSYKIAALMHSVSRGEKGFIARLHNAVKNHKPAGSVGFRAIHAMSLYSFEGLSFWLCDVLKPIVSKFGFVALDADSVLRYLRGLNLGAGDLYNVIHADIDDFFMIGSPAFLCEHVSALVGKADLRNLVRKVLGFLLANIFVSGAAPGLRQQVSGSSQGMKHSGLVAILAFVHAVELCGPGLGRRQFRLENGIVGYVRAIDNLLFITRRDVSGQVLVERLNTVLSPFRVKLECEWGCDEVAVGPVEFFDFELVKSPHYVSNGRLDYRPVLRDKGPLLSYLSAHPQHVHFTWPVAYLMRLHRRSSRIDTYVAAKAKFLVRMRSHGVPDFIIAHVDNVTNYHIPYHDLVPVKRQHLRGTSFLVLPFHPVWYRFRIAAAVARFCRETHHRRLLQNAFASDDSFLISTSWKLRGSALGNSLVDW